MRHHADYFPFAMADPNTTLGNKDIVSVDGLFPHTVTEMAYLRYKANRKWYWMRSQRPDEIILFIQVDTNPLGGTFNDVALIYATMPRRH